MDRQPQTLLRRARIIAALLLASIAWGSTVEFTHHHGARAARTAGVSDAAKLPAISTGSEDGALSVQTTERQNSSSRSNSGFECSICQLQHNLATTLISEWAGVATDEIPSAYAQTATSSQQSAITATRRGRAPPLNL